MGLYLKTLVLRYWHKIIYPVSWWIAVHGRIRAISQMCVRQQKQHCFLLWCYSRISSAIWCVVCSCSCMWSERGSAKWGRSVSNQWRRRLWGSPLLDVTNVYRHFFSLVENDSHCLYQKASYVFLPWINEEQELFRPQWVVLCWPSHPDPTVCLKVFTATNAAINWPFWDLWTQRCWTSSSSHSSHSNRFCLHLLGANCVFYMFLMFCW